VWILVNTTQKMYNKAMLWAATTHAVDRPAREAQQPMRQQRIGLEGVRIE
jgi:hypothetical protein